MVQARSRRCSVLPIAYSVWLQRQVAATSVIFRLVSHEPESHPTFNTASSLCKVRNARQQQESVMLCRLQLSCVPIPPMSRTRFLTPIHTATDTKSAYD